MHEGGTETNAALQCTTLNLIFNQQLICIANVCILVIEYEEQAIYLVTGVEMPRLGRLLCYSV